ncbi:uncharacterized protein [Dermacentor albipictus]|uniref:uncharacterized protein isoform X1 n=1 Tax=Dermacentor albipictus TaxID=60249 RepID=UPI0031FDD28F
MICLCYMEEGGSNFVVTRCGHTYHAECLRVWLDVSGTCPICRTATELDATIKLHGETECSAKPDCVVELRRANRELRRRLHNAEEEEDQETRRANKHGRASSEHTERYLNLKAKLSELEIELEATKKRAASSLQLRKEAIGLFKSLRARNPEKQGHGANAPYEAGPVGPGDAAEGGVHGVAADAADEGGPVGPADAGDEAQEQEDTL